MQVGKKIFSQRSRKTMTFYWLKNRARRPRTDHIGLKSLAAYAQAGRFDRPTLCVGMEIPWKPEKCRIVAQDLLFLPLPSSPCECVKSFFPRWINVMSECGRSAVGVPCRPGPVRGGRASKQGEVKLGGYMLGLGCACSHISWPQTSYLVGILQAYIITIMES